LAAVLTEAKIALPVPALTAVVSQTVPAVAVKVAEVPEAFSATVMTAAGKKPELSADAMVAKTPSGPANLLTSPIAEGSNIPVITAAAVIEEKVFATAAALPLAAADPTTATEATAVPLFPDEVIKVELLDVEEAKASHDR
jgi:hypothetical protein